MKKLIIAALAIAVVPVAAANAQTTASQKFSVTVPQNISITAPVDAVITHDETESDQTFAAQQWVVRGNALAGVIVNFSTDQAFTNTTDGSFKRDAQLSLGVASNQGPATWTVSQAADATDYANSDELATVQASSDGVGRATFDLGVTFVTDGFGSFAEGDYEMTVTGTVSSN